MASSDEDFCFRLKRVDFQGYESGKRVAFAGNKDRLRIIPIVVVIGGTSSIKDHVLPSLSQSQVEVENLSSVLF